MRSQLSKSRGLGVSVDLQRAREFYLRKLRVDYDYDTHREQIALIASQMESKQYADYLDRTKASRDISNSATAVSSTATAAGSLAGTAVAPRPII